MSAPNIAPEVGALKVWWIPQIPMDAFEVSVSTVEEAVLISDTLGRYDAFQFENNIKPDYCNVGGLVQFDGSDWIEWEDPETGEDFSEYRREIILAREPQS